MVQCPIVMHQHLTNPTQSIIHCGAVTARRGTGCTMLHNNGEEFHYVENQLLIGASRGSHRQKPNDNKTPVLMTQKPTINLPFATNSFMFAVRRFIADNHEKRCLLTTYCPLFILSVLKTQTVHWVTLSFTET